MQSKIILTMLSLGLICCSEQRSIQDKTIGSGLEAIGQDRQQTESLAEEDSQELVILPSATFGSKLHCEYNEDPQNLASSRILCALQSQEYPLKIPLQRIAEPMAIKWGYNIGDSMAQSVLVIDIRKDLSDPLWQVEYQLTKNVPEAFDYQSIVLGLELYYGEQHLVFQTQAIAKKARSSWLPFNGGRVPDEAIVAGSMGRGSTTLYLCRLHYENQVLPGKLLVPENLADPSVCSSFLGAQNILSELAQNMALNYPSDVLVINGSETQFDNVFAWVRAANGIIPQQAVVAGYTALGENLYICRGMEAGPPPNPADAGNNPAGEPTPGYIFEGRSNCTYEYYGVRSQAIYEVLVKQAATTET